MSENVTTDASSADPLKAVADAIETALQAAKGGAADAKATMGEALPATSRLLSRLIYTACYTLSYGVVFPTVLIARSVPKNNAVVHGLVDGAQAAMDMVDQLKGRELESSRAEPVAALPPAS